MMKTPAKRSSVSSTHRQRLEAVLAGKRPDRIPVALWRHFPVDDQDPFRLARATGAFANQYDFDLIKVTPGSSYSVHGWGTRDDWRGDPEGTRDIFTYPVRHPEDWMKIQPLDPFAGSLGAQLECLKLLVEHYGPDKPILQTIFNPLSQAKHLIGKELLLVHLHKYPDALKNALDAITQTTVDFVRACHIAGVDGVFFAVQHAQYGLLSEEEFEQFCRPYDLEILAAAQPMWLNMLHLHGENVMFDQLASYPVQIINWHDRSTEPNLAEGLKRFPGVVCGGLRRIESMLLGTPESIHAEALDAIQQTGGQRFILGTGCVVPITVPHGNLLAARNAVEKDGE